MIVWGGYNGDYLMTGGRYCACASSAYYRDGDGDGRGDAASPVLACSPVSGYVEDDTDCDDADAAAWGAPSEVPGLAFLDRVTLTWSAPQDPGGLTILYDVLRSDTPSDFLSPATCVVSNAASAPAGDPAAPPVAHAFFYLVRAESACPDGSGSLGSGSDGVPRQGRSCP
jgi:hypothetical protein